MGITPRVDVPIPIRGPGESITTDDSFRRTVHGDSHVDDMYPGSWLNSGSAQTQGIDLTTVAHQDVGWRTVSLHWDDGTLLPFQYVSAADANTTDSIYRMAVQAIGGIIFDMEEDADGAGVTDAQATAGGFLDLSADSTTNGCANPVAATVAAQQIQNPTGTASGRISFDSSDYAATQTAANNDETLELLSLSPRTGQVTSATTPRIFRAKLGPNKYLASQSA